MSTISQVGRDDQFALATYVHAQPALIPAFNHLANPNLKLGGLVAFITAVKFGAIFERAAIVHHHRLPGLGLCASAYFFI